jgi:hypothetical protein
MRERWVRVLAVCMAVISAPLVLMIVLAPIATVRVLCFDWARMPSDDRFVFSIAMPFAFLLGIYGVGMAVVARGLWRERRWAGVCAMVVCVSWCLVGLVPLGAFGLWAMLRAPVRREWLE